MEALKRLAKRYFVGIKAEDMTRKRLLELFNEHGKNLVLIQIVDQKVYVIKHPAYLDGEARRSRIESILYLLSQILKKESLPNLEFLVCVSDSIQSDFPILSSIGFPGKAVIPIPLGATHGPDGGTQTQGFDRKIEEIYRQNKTIGPIEHKIKKAIFRGTLRLSKGTTHYTNSMRGKLFDISQKHRENLDVGFTNIDSQEPSIPKEALIFLLGKKPLLALADQQNYLANLCVGAWAGWADRIRILPHLDSVTLLHESACYEYFQPLMIDGIHFIKIDNSFENLIDSIDLLKSNLSLAKTIIQNANSFAKTYITELAFEVFLKAVIDELSARIPYQVLKSGLDNNFPVAYVSNFAKVIAHSEEIKRTLMGYPASTAERSRPQSIDSCSSSVMDSANLSSNFDQANVFQLLNTKVHGKTGFLCTQSDVIISELSGNFGNRREKDPAFNVDWNVNVKKIKAGIHLGAPGLPNYFHWMFQFLPRFHLAQKLIPHYQQIPILIHKLSLPFHNETLNEMNFGALNIIELKTSETIMVDDLFVPSMPSIHYHIPLWVTAFLRKQFIPLKLLPLTEKLYISRINSSNRKVENESKLIDKLKKNKFRIVELEQLSVREQAMLFSKASHVIAFHGAGLSNLVFCHPSAQVLEIFQETNVHPLYWSLSELMHLSYQYLVNHDALLTENSINKIEKWCDRAL